MAPGRTLEGRIEYIEDDLYRGRGPQNPSITARLSEAEGNVEQLRTDQTKTTDRINAILWSALVGAISTVLTLVGVIYVAVTKH